MPSSDSTDQAAGPLDSFVNLGDISEIRSGWTSASAEQGSLLMVRTTDIAEGDIDWSTVPYCKIEPPNPSDYLLRSGDVLVARTGGSVGNTVYVAKPPTAVFASYMLRLRPTKDWDSRFVALFLQSPGGREALAERAQGATIQNLSAGRLATIPIPVFPLSHQVHVAERLMKSRSLVGQAVKRLDNVLMRLPDLEKQTLSLALSKVPEAQSGTEAWPQFAVSELTENRDRSRVPLNAETRKAHQGTTPYYGASGVIDHVDGHTHEGAHLLVSEDGNNLISRRTPIAFVVRGKFWANNHVHVLQVNDQLLPEYAAVHLNSMDLRPILTGTAQPKLTKRALDQITLPVPSLEVQQAIVESAARLQESWDKLQKNAEDLKARTLSAWDELLAATFAVGGPEVRAAEQGQQEALDRVLADVEAGVPVESSEPDDAGSRAEPPLSTPERTPPLQRTKPVGDIAEALQEWPNGLTPEQLFDAVDWLLVAGMDTVDAYYAALKRAVEAGFIREVRDSGQIRLVRT